MPTPPPSPPPEVQRDPGVKVHASAGSKGGKTGEGQLEGGGQLEGEVEDLLLHHLPHQVQAVEEVQQGKHNTFKHAVLPYSTSFD